MASQFQYNAEYQVLFCSEHQQAVKALDWHLKDSHGIRKKKECQPILDQYSSYVLLPPKDVRQPPAGCEPFDVLGKPLDGFECIECRHISINHTAIRRHCNIDHHWFVSKDEPTHWNVVKVQTFFGVGNIKYFIVHVPEPEQVVDPDMDDEQREVALQLAREFQEANAQDEERFQVVELQTEKSDKTGWWNFVKWNEHFRGRNMRRLAHASRLPDRTDKEMKYASAIVKAMIKNAIDGLDTLYDDTPHWLRTANSTERVENRPMVRLQNEDSLDTYITYFQRLVCYCLRVRNAQKARQESGRYRESQ